MDQSGFGVLRNRITAAGVGGLGAIGTLPLELILRAGFVQMHPGHGLRPLLKMLELLLLFCGFGLRDLFAFFTERWLASLTRRVSILRPVD